MNSSEPTHPFPSSRAFLIRSPGQFAQLIGLPVVDLEHLVTQIPTHYSPRFERKNGKVRRIDRPSETLKAIQRTINDKLLSKVRLPKYVIGGVKGRRHREHPAAHVGQPIVVTLDVRECYPRITGGQIFAVWRRLGCSRKVAKLATKLTVLNDYLPQGAPTSTNLANFVLFPAVQRISELAAQMGLKRLGQYVDDLAFSCTSLPDRFITSTVREFSREAIKINRKKVIVMRAGGRQVVTKRLVNRRVALPISERKKVRVALYQLTATSPQDPKYTKRYRSVHGRIGYLAQYHPRVGSKLLIKFKTLPQPGKAGSVPNSTA